MSLQDKPALGSWGLKRTPRQELLPPPTCSDQCPLLLRRYNDFIQPSGMSYPHGNCWDGSPLKLGLRPSSGPIPSFAAVEEGMSSQFPCPSSVYVGSGMEARGPSRCLPAGAGTSTVLGWASSRSRASPVCTSLKPLKLEQSVGGRGQHWRRGSFPHNMRTADIPKYSCHGKPASFQSCSVSSSLQVSDG